MKGKFVTVEKSEINYVKKFSFRHILSSLHFNENIKRESRKTKQGDPYVKVSYPKFKLGEEVVRGCCSSYLCMVSSWTITLHACMYAIYIIYAYVL